MENFLNRYRNLAVLLAVMVAQLLLLAYQIKSNGEVRLIRVWAIDAVTPLARLLETSRTGTAQWIKDYVFLADVRAENKRIQSELDKQKIDNQYLRTELLTSDRAKALALFIKDSPSTTTAARVIGNTTGAGAHVLIIDRGSTSGVEKGMAVITPEGIVGKITGVYPNASYVLLITDPSFAAGIISQKARIRGTLRGQGDGVPIVELIPNEAKIAPGDWFYTSGDDRIFPKGMPVGEVIAARAGNSYQTIQVRPSGLQNGLEDVLVVLNGVHGRIPDAPPTNQSVHLLPAPPPEPTDAPAPQAAVPNASGQSAPPQPSNNGVTASTTNTNGLLTDADRMLEKYRKIGAASGHVYGDSSSGAPNYNVSLTPPGDKTPLPAKP